MQEVKYAQFTEGENSTLGFKGQNIQEPMRLSKNIGIVDCITLAYMNLA